MSMLRRLVIALWWTVLLVGPPAGLVVWARWPLPTRWPDRVQAEAWLAHPLTADAAAVTGWLGWALLVWTILIRPHRRLRRTVEAVWSLAGLLAMLVGLPAGLIWWAGRPVPHWPTETQIHNFLAEPLTWPTIVAATALAGWLLWLTLVYAVLAEAATRLGRFARWLPRIPVPTPLQGLVGGMLGAAAISTAHTSASTIPEAADLAVVSTADRLPVAAANVSDAPDASTVHQEADPDPAALTSTSDRIMLPDGGWLPRAVAELVTAAGAAVWWRRRRDYQPGPIRLDRDDPDLVPLPPTVQVVQAALPYVQQPLPGLERPPAAATDPAGPPDDAGRLGWQAASWPGDLPGGAVRLVGAGAADAARGILTTALLTHREPAARPAVVITAADLHTLLGSAATDRRHLPGLQVTEDLGGTVQQLEQILLKAEPDRRDPASDQYAAHTLALLATAPADPDTARRLAVLASLGHRHGVTAAILGHWPTGTLLTVTADGTATRSDNHTEQVRFCMLPRPPPQIC
ncbi:hypothetical protein [Phytohabitans houttuyneae]|nr:hypothetical protein [Phytohabitans houttuyneae]